MKPNSCELKFLGHEDRWRILTPTVVEHLRTALFGPPVDASDASGERVDEATFSKGEVGVMKVVEPPRDGRGNWLPRTMGGRKVWPELGPHEQWAYPVRSGSQSVKYLSGDYTLGVLLRHNDDLRRQAYESEVERLRGLAKEEDAPRGFFNISSWNRRETIPFSRLEAAAQARCVGSPGKPGTPWQPDPALAKLRVLLDEASGLLLGYFAPNEVVSDAPNARFCEPPEERVELSKEEYAKLKDKGIL